MTKEVSKTAELIRATSGTEGADGWYLVICVVKGDAEVYRSHCAQGTSYRPTTMERLGRPRLVGHLVSADPHVVVSIPLQVAVEDIDMVSVTLRLDLAIGFDQVETFFRARSQRPLETLREWAESHIGPTIRQHLDNGVLTGGARPFIDLLVRHMAARDIGLDTITIPALERVAAEYGITVNGVRVTRELSEVTRSELVELTKLEQMPAKLKAEAMVAKAKIETSTDVGETKLEADHRLKLVELRNRRVTQALEAGIEIRSSFVEGIRTVITNLANEIDTPNKIPNAITALDRLVSRVNGFEPDGNANPSPSLLPGTSFGSGDALAGLPAPGNYLGRMLMEVFMPLTPISDHDRNMRRVLALLAHCVAEASLGDDANSAAIRRYFTELDEAREAVGLNDMDDATFTHIRTQVHKLRSATGIMADD